ncbi:PREDICTED: cyclin-D1-1-like isoform X2 [Populus euphratica]|uniref:B-like cyclin n=1 Tax=Populus euphratica TaxID=75702 RepID=A0AAJ6ULC5_POPEU|nr:PREDICTED: cyclin-D1-1-like isoform X2 [Populus euphratica]
MSVSADVSTPSVNLYCNETAGDALCSSNDGGISEINSAYLPVDIDESYIDNILVSELHQMPETELITRFPDIPESGSAHQDTLNWMLKVHAYYRFRPETAYLSANYFHCFILSHTLQKGKGWPLQLLAVACLSLAAKLEETRVPSLLDIQTLEPRFLFKPSTVRRMELLVMGSLKWRLHIITPFSFLHYFIAKLSHLSPRSKNLILAHSSDVIISTCRVMNILAYTPSTIAAAAVLWVTDQSIGCPKLECFHNRMNKEMVKGCYNLIKQNTPQLSRGKALDATMPGKCFAKKCWRKDFKSSQDMSPSKC